LKNHCDNGSRDEHAVEALGLKLSFAAASSIDDSGSPAFEAIRSQSRIDGPYDDGQM